MSSFSTQRLEGQVAIVTGSSSGIGEAIALLFAEKGANVTLCGRNSARLESTKVKCQEASGHSGQFITVQGDLSDPMVWSRIVEETVKHFGKLDILVLNAGLSPLPSPFLDATEADFDTCMDVMLKANVFLIQESIPHLEKVKGRVAVVSSMAGVSAAPDQWQYSVIKAGVNQLIKVLSIPLGNKGIRINGTCPGMAETNILRSFGDQMKEVYKQIEKSGCNYLTPLGNRITSLREQADVVAFLVSPQSEMIHGEIILTDGAFSRVCPSYNQSQPLPSQSLNIYMKAVSQPKEN